MAEINDTKIKEKSEISCFFYAIWLRNDGTQISYASQNLFTKSYRLDAGEQ